MAMYEYKGQTPAGREMAGTLEAESLDAAKEALGLMRLTVHSLREVRVREPVTRIGRSEFLLFNQQLAGIAKANVPLERALRQLVSDVRSPSVRRLIERVAGEMESGATIEDAFARHGGSFPPMYGKILAAGVKTGRLAEMLTSMNRHLHFASRTRRIVLEAMAYPMVVLAFGVALFTGVLVFMVPDYKLMVADFGAELPGVTGVLFWLSDHVGLLWSVAGLVLVAALVASATLRRFPGGRRCLERIGFGVPGLGRVYRDSVLSRLTDSIAVLIGAGCDLPEALRMGGEASGSETVRTECDRIAEHVAAGNDLESAQQHCWVIPGLLTHSMHVASERNDMADAMYGLSEMYAQHATAAQAALRAILMPVMLILCAFVLSLFITALFLPIVRMISWMGS